MPGQKSPRTILFSFYILQLYLPVLCIKPTLPICKCKTSHLLNIHFLGAELSPQKSSSWHAAEWKQHSLGELLYEISKSDWQLEPRWMALKRYAQSTGRQQLQPIIPELPGKDTHEGSKKHQYCWNLATATVRKVLRHEEEPVFARLWPTSLP